MADDRLYNLTNEATPSDDIHILIDHPDFAEARQSTKEQFLSDEVTARENADNAIIDGAGLQADGSLSPDPASAYLRAADFLDAGYDVDLRNGLRLLDTAISAAVSGSDLEIQIDLSSAEILALGTEITKIAAPGANRLFHFKELIATNHFNSAAYTSAGAGGIDVQFIGAADQICNLPDTFLEAAATVTNKFLINTHEIPTNIGVEVVAPDGNPINGDGTISLILTYVIRPAVVYGGAAAISDCCVQPLADTFVNADLTVGGNLVIYHGFNTLNVFAIVLDNTGLQQAVLPAAGDEAGADTYNYITIPIGGPIAGTWRYALIIY